MPEQKQETYFIVSYEGNWGDELDFGGKALFTQTEWDELIENTKQKFTEGQNVIAYAPNDQAVTYDNFDDWFYCYQLQEVPKEHFDVLKLYSDCMYNDFLNPTEG